MTKKYYFILTVFLTVALAACDDSNTELRMHKPAHSAVEGSLLQPIFEQNSGLRVVDDGLNSTKSGLEALVKGEADLALIENSSSFQQGVRTVLPVYKSVLHLLTRQGIKLDHPGQPLRDR